MNISKHFIGVAILTLALSSYGQTSGFFISGILGINNSNLGFTKKDPGSKVYSRTDVNGVWTDSNFTTSGNVNHDTNEGEVYPGLKFGFIQAINNFTSIRIYGAYSFGNISIGTNHLGAEFQGMQLQTFNTHRLGIGADYVLAFSNKINAWAVFVGGGYEYWLGEAYKKVSEMGMVNTSLNHHFPYANIGLIKHFASGKWSLEFGYKYYLQNLFFNGHKDFKTWQDSDFVRNEATSDPITTSLQNKQTGLAYIAFTYKFGS